MRTPAPLPAPLDGSPFLVADALRAGVTPARLRSSDLVMPFHGVRAASADSLLELAGAYAVRMPAHHAYGGITAGRIWGFPLPTDWTPGEALVVARPTGTTRGRSQGTTHIAVDARLRATIHRGLPVLAPAATAVTLGRVLEHEHLVHVVDALLATSWNYPDLDLPRRPHATVDELTTFLARCVGVPGVPALRAALDDARAGVESRFESITRRCIVLAGLPEPVVHPLVVVDGIALHPDLGYPDLRIAIEYEGDGHREAGRWDRDIDRYARLEAAGWIVVRITKAHLARGGDRAIRRVEAAIARRR
ncbi:hypothetical protein ABIB37_000632 [Agrococcus sp. UYP10]|uniref:endonuclease domain-containing protein n=1 Tax=Agrococcus sp. UYP10 TaxID=1756355 RepID=UPI00339519FA